MSKKKKLPKSWSKFQPIGQANSYTPNRKDSKGKLHLRDMKAALKQSKRDSK